MNKHGIDLITLLIFIFIGLPTALFLDWIFTPAHANLNDVCVWHICPQGSTIWHEHGGVTIAKSDAKDCIRQGQGTRAQAEEFVAANRGKHLLLECRKAGK